MDDDRLIRELLSLQLAACGYEVEAAACGEDAVIAYREAREAGRPFDAVILDLQVRDGWGGEETLVELMRLDARVRAIVFSGTLQGSVEHYKRQGFHGVLAKPCSQADLHCEVEAVLHAPE